MDADVHDDDEMTRIFPRKTNVDKHFDWYIIGGGVCVVWAILGMIVAFRGNVNQISLQGMTTIPLMMALFLFYRAWLIVKAPREIHLSVKGISIITKYHQQDISWDDIGLVLNEAALGGKQIKIFNGEGRKLMVLPDAFVDFEILADTILDTVAQKNVQRNQFIAKRKARRTAIFIGSVGLVFLAGAISLLWMARREQNDIERLKTSAVVGEAQIVRRFLAPNGVTPRLEYGIVDAEGMMVKRNAEVTRSYWDSLENVESVAVRYVPDDVRISRLLKGEVEDKDIMNSPKGMYVVGLMGIGMSLFFLVGAVILFLGYDMDFDSKTHKFSIKRYGAGR
ncbi:MAG: hypothetical protein JW709_07905 [Sedimentisphaerales bacterium]|nr:hypothetical protein [Sedimentisphaerales bacterium]